MLEKQSLAQTAATSANVATLTSTSGGTVTVLYGFTYRAPQKPVKKPKPKPAP